MDVNIVQITNENEKWKHDLENLLGKSAAQDIQQTSQHFHAYFAAYLDNEMVGHSVILKSNNSNMWILDSLFVKPSLRGKGIAKKLSEARISFAKANGAVELWYCCSDKNISSIESHKNYIFEKVKPATAEETPVPSSWYRLKL